MDVPLYDYGTKGAVAPPSKEGKKVVYVNAVNMSCARWEAYQANVRWRVLRGENMDSLVSWDRTGSPFSLIITLVSLHLKLVPLSRHSHLPELMNFVTLFRPLHVVPNTLDPSLDGLDWGAMSKMFSGCLSTASTPGSLVSVMAPPCSLTSHPSVIRFPGPSTKCDPRRLFRTGEEGQVDTAYSNLVGPSNAADEWGDKGGKRARMEVLKAWIGTGRRKSLAGMHRDSDEDEDAQQENDTEEYGLMAGPNQLGPSPVIAHRNPKRYADDSDDSSDEGGSDNHARTAWQFFGVGELEDGCKTWLSPSPQSQFRVRAEALVDIGTLPTPTSSPLPLERRLVGDNKGKERAIEHASQRDLPIVTPVRSSLGRAPTEIALPSVGPEAPRITSFVSFDDVGFSGQFLEEQTNEAVGSGSQPFVCLDNVVLPNPSQSLVSSHHLTQHQSQSQQTPEPHGRTSPNTKSVGDISTKTNMENVGEAPPSKRRKINREESNGKVGEKDDVHELAGGKLVQSQNMDLVPCRRDESLELSHESSSGLTRTATVPSLASGDDKNVSLPPTSPDPEVEGDSGTFPQSIPTRTVTTTATISFPVRKRVEDRAKYTGKTVPLSRPGRAVSPPRKGGLASCSTSAIVRLPALEVDRASTIVRAESLSVHTSAISLNASTHINNGPVSPRTAARRAERAQRRRITEKLRLARPDLVVQAQTSRQGSRSRVLERVATLGPAVGSTSVTCGRETKERAGSADDGMDVTDEDTNMDWEKSRQLAERVRAAVQRGHRASDVLPRLSCLERWNAEGGND